MRGITFFADRADAVAGLLDLIGRFLDRQGQPFEIFDIVDPVVARNNQPQGATVRERHGFAVHLPREDRAIHRSLGDRAFNLDRFRRQPLGNILSAGAGQIHGIRIGAAHCVNNGAHGHTCPHDIARRPDRPLRPARLVIEEGAPIARALQHAHDRFDAKRFQRTDGHLAGVCNTVDLDLPGIAVGNDLVRGGGQVVADVKFGCGGDQL